jgi:hypothetical protein
MNVAFLLNTSLAITGILLKRAEFFLEFLQIYEHIYFNLIFSSVRNLGHEFLVDCWFVPFHPEQSLSRGYFCHFTCV